MAYIPQIHLTPPPPKMTIKLIYSQGIKVFYCGVVFENFWYLIVITYKNLQLKLKSTQAHRKQYSDKTGELHPVKDFVLPVSNEKMHENFLP
jgi:hypothetical protein